MVKENTTKDGKLRKSIMEPIIKSILDDDLYKITQQHAVISQYPKAMARYQFINRGKTKFPQGFATLLREQVAMCGNLSMTLDEKEFLSKRCYFLPPPMIDFLYGFKFNPKEVSIFQVDDNIEITVEGPWYSAIRWEVILMAMVSELYFKVSKNITLTAPNLLDTPAQVEENAILKSKRLKEANVRYADFGTRRRFSYNVQKKVVETFKKYGENLFSGTSNIHLAMINDITPIGTQAHEWFSFHGAKYGFKMANVSAMGKWVDTYHGNLGIVLPDTFGTENFWASFDSFYARLFDGVRHDSGDPIKFGERAIKHYESLRIDPKSKTVVFSDGIATEEAIRIQKYFEGKIKISFGIGTHFTNDVGALPLNMVIKMVQCKPDKNSDWLHTIKLSDVPGKHTGDPSTVDLCKSTLLVKNNE